MSKTDTTKMAASLQISVNGEKRSVAFGETLESLLLGLGIEGGKVAVERNKAIAPRSQYADIRLEEGDELEIVRFVGGG